MIFGCTYGFARIQRFRHIHSCSKSFAVARACFFFFFLFHSPQETGRPTWTNTVTGEITIVPPKGMRNITKMTEDMEKQKELLRAKRAKKRR